MAEKHDSIVREEPKILIFSNSLDQAAKQEQIQDPEIRGEKCLNNHFHNFQGMHQYIINKGAICLLFGSIAAYCYELRVRIH